MSGGDIWEVPARGGDARLLVSHPATESRPIYSPDGTRLAFTSTRTGNGDIYVLALATGELTRLTFDDASELMNGWSADGAGSISPPRSHDLGSMTDVYRVSAGGGTPMPVAADRFATEYFASPAPSGDVVAISARGSAGLQWWRNGHSHLDESEIWLVRGGHAALRAGHQRRRERHLADVERRRENAVLHVGPERRTKHLERARRECRGGEGDHDVHERPGLVADDLERRQDRRLRAWVRHLDGGHRKRAVT